MNDTTNSSETTEPITINELLGSEGGVWCVVTRDSRHFFDLDNRTVVRVPGSAARPMLGDPVRPLREITSCRVGESGAWTMHTDGWDPEIDYYWHRSSVIQEIRRVSTAASTPGSDDGVEA
jgi:hypothetical protein